ncbi:FtsX-like permease family protein [Yoonia sp.]|nr:FtsX-like permease family protein [Yoonia sp.]
MKRLIASLSLRSLLHRRLEFICNAALIMGVVIPLLAVLGAKNGINDGLMAQLTESAGLLDIQTTGNDLVTEEGLAQVAALDGVVFATFLVRSGNDFMIADSTTSDGFPNVRLRVTGEGDPTLQGITAPQGQQAVISSELAKRLNIGVGDSFNASTGNDGRIRHALATMTVKNVLPSEALPGIAMLVSLDFTEKLEAYGDGYAVPEFGINEGLNLGTREPSFKGVRVTVAELLDVPRVDAAIGTLLNRNTRSEAAAVQSTLATQRYLDRAFKMIAVVGLLGVLAALTAAQVNGVTQQRRGLATLVLLGSARKDIALFPVLPTLVTVLVGLVLSLIGYSVLGQLAGFVGGADAPVVLRLRPGDVAALFLVSLLVASVACLFAIHKLLSVDPAVILRDPI